MRIGFRQGIIKGQRLPDFLIKNGNYVSFNASRMPTLLNFAEGSSNYLVYEKDSIDNAWSIPNQECWLYWDINKETAERTFGYTTKNPFQKTKPTSPVLNEMFFDVSSMRFKAWDGQYWTDVIRLIAGHIDSSETLTVQSNGSQIDVIMQVSLDEIVLDNGLPVKKYTDDGFEFYTKSNITTYTKNNNIAYTFDNLIGSFGKAKSSISKHSCITWSLSGNSLETADPQKLYQPSFGLAERDALTDELVSIVTDGFVTNRYDWNWSSPVNTPLYVGANGSIVTETDPENSIQRIGYIVSPNTIYISMSDQYTKFVGN